MRTLNSFVFGLSLFGALLFAGSVPQVAQADIVIDVQASLMPHEAAALGNYELNFYSYFFGLSYPNDPAINPSAIVILGDTVDAYQLITSDLITSDGSGGFRSWYGQANPPAPANLQNGTLVCPGGSSITSDTSMDLRNVEIEIKSGGGNFLGHILDYGTLGLANSDTYPEGVIGLYHGSIVTTIGEPVDTFWFSSATANAVSAVGALGASNQEKLDNTALFVRSLNYVEIIISYNSGDSVLSASKVMSVPEPASLAFFTIGVALLFKRRHKN